MAADQCAVVIVLDGLPAGLVGAYGNTWLPTPTIDRLASHSLVQEFPWIDSLDPRSYTDAVFLGQHVCCRPRKDLPGIGSLLRDRRIDSVLLTDHEPLAIHPRVTEFTDGELFKAELPKEAAECMESTMVAQFLATSADRLARIDRRSLVWLQFHGLLDCWDAPWEWRCIVTDETDPLPPEGVAPMERQLSPDADPDLALGAVQALAAQVAVVDNCLAPFLEAIDHWFDPQQTLLMLTSSRGFALGEHGAVGSAGAGLHSELLHVPLIVRTPSSRHQPHRCPQLVQPPSIFGTLADWFDLGCDRRSTGANSLLVADAANRTSSRAVSRTTGSAALRVPAWFFISDPPRTTLANVESVEANCQLYAKPDDRWDANDVASRCPEIVQEMQQQLLAFHDAARKNRLDLLPDLPGELSQPHR